MKIYFLAVLLAPFVSAKTKIYPGDPCIDIDGCECQYPINIDVQHRYINKKDNVECKFTSFCFENASGVNCQDSDAADIECDSVDSCPTSLVGHFDDVFPETNYTRHFVFIGKNRYVNMMGLKELNDRLNKNVTDFVNDLKRGDSDEKSTGKNLPFSCPMDDDKIDGCMLSWGEITEESMIAQNKILKGIVKDQRDKMVEINGETVIQDVDESYTLPILESMLITDVKVCDIEMSRTENPERIKNMQLKFKYRFGIFIPKGARASLSDGMIELDYDDGETWKCPSDSRKSEEEEKFRDILNNDPLIKNKADLITAMMEKHMKLWEKVCLCNASLDICPNSKDGSPQFCHLLGPEPYCHSKDVASLADSNECTDFFGCRCDAKKKRDEKASNIELIGALIKKKTKLAISKFKNMFTKTSEPNQEETKKVEPAVSEVDPAKQLQKLSDEIHDRRKYEIIRKNFICGDDRYNSRESERECVDEFCYCSELERAKKDTKCASAIKDNENRLKIGDVCRAENGCFCYNVGMIGVTCAKNEVCNGPNLIASFVMNSIAMTAQKKLVFASLDIPKLQVMTCRRDKNAQKFWKCTNDRGCFCGYSALACKKDMFCRLSKAKNLCMEKETSAAFEFRNSIKSFKQKIAKALYDGLSSRVKDENGKEGSGPSKVAL